MSIPFLKSQFYCQHGPLLCKSYERYTGQSLLPRNLTTSELIEDLFTAPFALVSHGTEEDPIFNFGNQTALTLFELTWEDFTRLPSRQSAEPMNQRDRQQLLDLVTKQGYIDNYSGIRITSTGKRFMITAATVWNLIDDQGQYHGQAAIFDMWSFL